MFLDLQEHWALKKKNTDMRALKEGRKGDLGFYLNIFDVFY